MSINVDDSYLSKPQIHFEDGRFIPNQLKLPRESSPLLIQSDIQIYICNFDVSAQGIGKFLMYVWIVVRLDVNWFVILR